jgi:hypothetical protein
MSDKVTDHIVDIGEDVYYLGPSTVAIMTTIQDLNDDTKKSLRRIGVKQHIIKHPGEFFENYSNGMPKEELVRLVKRYCKQGETKKILADNGTLTVDSEEDRAALISILTQRAENLEKQPIRYIIDYNPHHIAENIRRIIQYIITAPITTTSLSEITVEDEDLLGMIARMSWYLLHPEVVREDVHESWQKVLEDIRNVSVDDIMKSIHDLKLSQHGVPEVSSELENRPELKQNIISMLRMLEGIAFVNPSAEEKAVHVEKKQGGAIHSRNRITLPSSFIQSALNPVIDHITHIHPVYSILTRLESECNHTLIWSLERLLRICHSISEEKYYGFYRISGMPLETFRYIQRHITFLKEYRLYEEIPHANQKTYQYFLCLQGNISFTTVKQTTAKQKAECKAVRQYFKNDTIYILYTPKKKLDMALYLDDPFRAYHINCGSINDDRNMMEITEMDGPINDSIELSRYLTANPMGIFDEKQLELSVFHQLNRLRIL